MFHPHVARSRFLLLASLGGLAACGGGGATAMSDSAELRLLQADPGVTQSVDLVVDGQVMASGIAYGSASGLVRTSAGAHHLSVRSGATVLAERDETLTAGGRYYAVNATGQLVVTRAAVAVPDTGQPRPTRANIRFVNIVGGPAVPAEINAILRSPTTVDTAQTFQIDTRVSQYWSLMYLNPGPIVIRFQPVGESTLLAELTFDVAAGEVKAVIIERDATGALHPRVITEQ